MFNISQNKLITMTRGDSALFSLSINRGTIAEPDYYELQEGDKLYFGVTEPHKSFELGLIMKVLTSEDCIGSIVAITLKPEDTEYVLPGTYYYSLKLRTADDDVYTIIDKRKFVVID